MNHPIPSRSLHLGIREGELTGKPYAAFWNPRLAPLAEHAREALLCGPLAAPLLPDLADAPRLLEAGDHEVENGLGCRDDGALFVAVRTTMPDVSPAMVDWWFGWHGKEPERYKLWHPRAHVHACWGDADPPGAQGRARYVGRVSFVDEYIGSRLQQVTIRFVRPAELGFDEAALADPAESTVVCARVGLVGLPVDAGWLVHHVRRVPGGAEMRSRFWLGGPHGGVRAPGFVGAVASRIARRVAAPSLEEARALLVHCSQEMTHLASFLPRLHEELRELP
ncbi:hypothetical protein [Polyangium sp. 6x1]|uniref:DAPG hydrolase family protein n=1 Tax=Polyangium sp. 6x1 TaxID=3042689 RepID=UPI002483049A|nr:hypothetical protein [Polyangium sp. 6x1]MDI1445591.1 hypothetical protein [Polyangium sp. 6x1]